MHTHFSVEKAQPHCNHDLWDHTSVGKHTQLSGTPVEAQALQYQSGTEQNLKFPP